MPRFVFLAVAGSLVALVAAQTSTVTQVFLPLADPQPLDASVIAQSGDIKTLVVECAPGSPAESCGFPQPITVTVGPSTFHYNPTGIYEIFGELDCKITGTTEAICALTAPVYDSASPATASDADPITTPAPSSVTTTTTASGSALTWIPVTITAGQVSEASSTGSSSTSSRTGSSTGTPTASRSGTGGLAGPTTTGTATGSSSAATTTSKTGAAASVNAIYHGMVVGLLALPMLLL